MRVREIPADLFELSAPALAHGVNCAGVMGAGVALQMRRFYPLMYERYVELCAADKLTPGRVWPYRGAGGRIVYNLATQDEPGPNARLEWIFESVAKMASHAEAEGIDTIATVRLGCGIGGLTWDEVAPALEAISADIELQVAVEPKGLMPPEEEEL